jgi:hypothetical protein
MERVSGATASVVKLQSAPEIVPAEFFSSGDLVTGLQLVLERRPVVDWSQGPLPGWCSRLQGQSPAQVLRKCVSSGRIELRS